MSEGYVGIVKGFGKAINQVDPGNLVKAPFVVTVTDIEVRQRKTIEDLQAAIQDQLPIPAAVSINWTVLRRSTIDMFRQYGNLKQFENRILNLQLRSASKAALSRFPANKLTQERQTVVADIMDTMTGELALMSSKRLPISERRLMSEYTRDWSCGGQKNAARGLAVRHWSDKPSRANEPLSERV